jgi:hypothetical protein
LIVFATTVTRIPPTPPTIPPVATGVDRPLWSVMIPIFNCRGYLGESLRSVLRQAPSVDVMQIAVIDDASTDVDVKQMVQDISGDRVEYFRQPQNVGVLRNFNSCLERARGQFLHLLHADDRVLPGFYAVIGKLLSEYPQAAAAFARQRYIDESGDVLAIPAPEGDAEGLLEGWLERIAIEQRLQYVAIAVRRRVYEELGGFFGVTYGEDWEMWVRIASKYPIAYTPEPLADYRIHQRSITHANLRSGQNIIDNAWVRRTIQTYIPDACKKRVWKESAIACAYDGLEIANRLWREEGNKQAAQRQIMEATRLHAHPAICFEILKLYARMSLNMR